MKRLTRFIIWSLPILVGCDQSNEPYPKEVIVLGFDGMDPDLCETMMKDGLLPNLAKIAAAGSFKKLGTSTPPQSPVAWSDLITGVDSGRHGVFDFVHRDPRTALPFSFAAAEEAVEPLPLVGDRINNVTMFGYTFPLRSAKLKTNRHAPAFWEQLTRNGVPAHVFRMPANYPPTPSPGAHYCCLSDMGTVDLVNSLGTFSYYTEDPDERTRRITEGGGNLYPIVLTNHRAIALLVGPENSLIASKSKSPTSRKKNVEIPFVISRDPVEKTAAIEYAGRTVILNEGEWSDWQPIEFEMIPHALALNGECRFYLKQVHPYLKLFVTPFNFDPQEKSWEIDQPADWSVRVSDAVGRYYTQGLPENTKALSNKVFSRDEFLRQADLVLEERLKLLDFALDHFKGGLLFFYFGTTDQVGHMFWGAREPGHPAITPAEHEKYKRVMEGIYARMDDIVGKVSQRFPSATMIVMSDHGFCSYRRSFNLNTWLKDNGYAAMRNPFKPTDDFNFDFTKTKAYALGLNGLYINVQGRENQGIVAPADKSALMDEIIQKLKAYRDPDTGEQCVVEVSRGDAIYSGPMAGVGPDMVVGYARGYRGSGGSALGEFKEKIVEDNLDAWCGDHCVASHLVPGVLFTNHPVPIDAPTLRDLAPTILRAFNQSPPPSMRGRDLFSPTPALARR